VEFPHIQKLYQEFKDKGLAVAAVDSGDATQVVVKYFKDSGFTFPSLVTEKTNAVFDKYGVRACPTNYLITPDGKVMARFIGFNEQEIRKAIGAAGIK
jgi:thiol-disulfide isomerase/thioredoxin